MAIKFNKETGIFNLQGNNASYILKVCQGGYLAHVYFGKRINHITGEVFPTRWRSSFSPNTGEEEPFFSLDTLPQEYPSYGNCDLRSPAYIVQLDNGSTITDLRYQTHTILKGKPLLDGLPSTYVEEEDEADTLEITMLDGLIGLKVILSYTVYKNLNVVTRNARFINEGKSNLKLLRAFSASMDFGSDQYDFLHLYGAWTKERNVERRPLFSGTQSVESRRGASSHSHNPFIAILGKDTTEENGDAYGFSLVYSGNFIAQAEVDQYQTTRVSIGINSFDFSWLLEPGEHFQTPEVVMVYSAEGIGGMSRIYHKLYRTRLCRGNFRDKVRPILVNNWEATYFDFTAEKIEEIAIAGKDLGIELMVLDDGWFGKRDSANCSLGDWVADTKKLPQGVDGLAKAVNKIGMQFGLWFEPEMISPDSDLYRKHPDWCIHVQNRKSSLARTQLILDLSRDEVCEYIIEAVSNILSTAPISYVKWDMNRNMTEIGSARLPAERQRETAHRYMLGLYKILEKITSNFPDVLFESCSGGGGRFDPGMHYYMPLAWTSDDSDAIERLKIQYGTSIVYPISTMAAHVTDIPNHQVARNTPFNTRGAVAMTGNFGYELDITKLTEDEKAEVKVQINQFKELREFIQFGDMYRLLSPFEGNETAWMFVSEDKVDAFVVYVRVLAEPNAPIKRLKLRGLDPNREYSILNSEGINGGDELMYLGLAIPELTGDFQSVTWRLKNKDKSNV